MKEKIKKEYLRIRKINPHIPAWAVLKYVKSLPDRYWRGR